MELSTGRPSVKPWSTNCTIVHKCLRGVTPSYLVEMCQPVSSDVTGRSCLRSSIRCDLAVPRTKSTTYGPRSFAVSGPTSWNSLPQSFHDATQTLGQFQRRPKTSLFRLAYAGVIWLHGARDCALQIHELNWTSPDDEMRQLIQAKQQRNAGELTFAEMVVIVQKKPSWTLVTRLTCMPDTLSYSSNKILRTK